MGLSKSFVSIVLLVAKLSLFSQDFQVCKSANNFTFFEAKNKKLTSKSIDVKGYQLNLVLNPRVNYIQGNVGISFESLEDSLVDLKIELKSPMILDSVMNNGQLLPFQKLDQLFWEINLSRALFLGDSLSMQLYYHGTPDTSGFGPFVLDSNQFQHPILWTLSQPFGSSSWWPCINSIQDKADAVEMNLQIPLEFQAASLGKLILIDTINVNEHVFSYKSNYPVSPYLIGVAVGKYDRIEEIKSVNGSNLLFQYFLYPEDSLSLKQSLEVTYPFMEFYDSILGPYPFMNEKYGHASFTFGGGMEHQTLSFMGNYGGELIAHELIHQWLGNKLSCESWTEIWLHEGFATYLTALSYEFGILHDPIFFPGLIDDFHQASFAHPHESVYREDTSSVDQLFNALTYKKAAAVIHTLRFSVGDSAFFQGLRNMIMDSSLAYHNFNAKDLRRHLEISSGLDLKEFFKDWINSKGFPTVYSNWVQNGNSLKLSVFQRQSDPSVYYYDFIHPFKIYGANWDSTINFQPRYSGESLSIEIRNRIDSIVFDPENFIAAKSEFSIGLKETERTQNIAKVYPNPSTSFLSFEFGEEYQLKSLSLVNTKGQEFYFPLQQRINMEQFSPGLYLVKLEFRNHIEEHIISKL